VRFSKACRELIKLHSEVSFHHRRLLRCGNHRVRVGSAGTAQSGALGTKSVYYYSENQHSLLMIIMKFWPTDRRNLEKKSSFSQLVEFLTMGLTDLPKLKSALASSDVSGGNTTLGNLKV